MSETSTPPEGNWTISKRWVSFFVLVGVVLLLYLRYGEYLDLDYLADREAQLERFQANSPLIVYGLAFAIYVTATGLSIPGAALLTLVAGWYFGSWRGLVLVSFASSIGSTIAFLLSRYFFRDFVGRRFSDEVQIFDKALQHEGAFYLFTLRLIAVIPFFVINTVMGLTKIRPLTFYWVSQLGMLPGTAVYVYAGSQVPSLQALADDGIRAVFTLEQLVPIFIAFALLGIFPLVTKWLLKRIRPQAAQRVEKLAGQEGGSER